MKSHYCPEEKAIIQFDGQCNWCGAKEMNKPVALTYKEAINQPHTVTFSRNNSEWVMQLTADKKIIVNEDVEVSEAAQAVLDALQPLLAQAHPVKELTDEEIDQITDECCLSYYDPSAYREYAKAILRKAQEK